MAIFFSFLLYRGMVKWSNIKTFDGYNLKFPQTMQLKDGLVAKFDEFSQIISVRKGERELGYDMLIKSKDRIKCVDIEVQPEFKRRGIGGLLHAISVMMMKENKAKNIYLDALPQAIRFHFNKGFRTDCTNKENAYIYMNSIIRSNTPFEDLKISAKKLMFKLTSGGKEAIKEADKLYDTYLSRVIHNNISIDDANLPATLCMDLKNKDLKKHGDFYNGILESFGIDYRI